MLEILHENKKRVARALLFDDNYRCCARGIKDIFFPFEHCAVK